jgi:hypothetical protein
MSEYQPDCYTATNPRARKTHRCCECHGTIQPGELYHRFSGVWDGEAMTFKTCSDCQQIRNEYNADLDYEDQARFEELWDGVYESNLNRPRDLAQRMVDVMRKRGANLPSYWEDAK